MWLSRAAIFCVLLTVVSGQTDYFWHLTDIHYDPDFWTYPEPCAEGLEKGDLGALGCESPWELVESSIRAMFDNGRVPEFIIWTGDTNSHPRNTSRMSTEKKLQNLRNTTELIKYHFPDVPVYVTLGNHDFYPDGQLPGESNPLYEGAADLWQDWINTPQANETFRRGGYYTIPMAVRGGGVDGIMLNTNLYSPDNLATVGQSDPGGQYQWLEETLQTARTNQIQVHILMHIPPGVLELPGSITWMREADSRRLSNIFVKYSDVIIAIYSGHSHFDSFRLFYDEGEPKAGLLIAPAVTSWSPAEQRPTNPAVRKITYDRLMKHLVDVEQYYIDLQNFRQPNVNWVRLYGFRAAYGVTNVTVPSLQELLDDFKKYASENFHRYEEFNAVRLDRLHRQNPPCGCVCKLKHLCAIEFVDFEEHAECVQSDYCTAGASHKFASSWVVALAIVASELLNFIGN